ncbi:hypothetical protein DSC45_24410 [Streptomyces sp. YIM 130001]|nr:hypothetical protein DSC45_24410 [Streptomyces sp. YIM 130001]
MIWRENNTWLCVLRYVSAQAASDFLAVHGATRRTGQRLRRSRSRVPFAAAARAASGRAMRIIR